MSIFGTATGILSVIGFLPDVFIHTWYGSMIDAQGVDAFTSIFGFEIMFGVIGCLCLLMLLRTVKRHFGGKEEGEAEKGETSER